ncbi:TetR/AcrR family transcriptional regulator [Nocardia sp. NPDC058176]|uniref:TetR/AcrR family transcriptional regulator n=1 Tax=Nocardia sp. NPDC058176 TaxID=3346368 RepID=UPI0036D8ADC6
MSTDRRGQIVAGAIELIATRGIRALTHRGVDTLLELPSGSTSYYFRTRHALIEAVADGITARSRADFAAAHPDTAPDLNIGMVSAGTTSPAQTDTAVAQDRPAATQQRRSAPAEPQATQQPAAFSRSAQEGPLDPVTVAHDIAGWLDQLLTHRRSELIARHALIIEVLSDPDLHARLAGSLFALDRATELFTALGADDPRGTAGDFLALLEGLVFDRFAGLRAESPTGTPDSVAQLARPLSSFLTSARQPTRATGP